MLRLNRSAAAETFFGVGAISGGGATSRLLVDYPAPQRAEILDILFNKSFGASLHMLKVEIGGDSQSTDGSEPSHMHSIDDLNFERGYEWWLLSEAKKRNPEIKTYALPWAFPGWVGCTNGTHNCTQSPFAYINQTAQYVANWLHGAKTRYNVTIDYVGVWNERQSTVPYTRTLKAKLAEFGLHDVKLVANDGWDCPTADYAESIDIIGVHYPSDDWDWEGCHKLGKPIWASEDSSSYDDLNGAACWSRVLTSHYVAAGMTGTIMWNLVGAYYHGTNWYASSLLTAVQPWSGHYDVDDRSLAVVYATAHLTQFTQPGWKYLPVNHGSGELSKGGYVTTLIDPDSDDFTVMVVKIDHEHAFCTRPTLPGYTTEAENVTLAFDASMALPKSVVIWRSNFQDEANPLVFEQQEAKVISPTDRTLTLEVQVGDVFTISTVTSASKGVKFSPPPSEPNFPLPYSDSFESTLVSQEAPLFTDQIGVFEVHEDDTKRSGAVNHIMRQMVPRQPVGWSDHGGRAPVSLIGMREWQDVNATISFKLPPPADASPSPSACMGARTDQMWDRGIVFCVNASGGWNLTMAGPELEIVVDGAGQNVGFGGPGPGQGDGKVRAHHDGRRREMVHHGPRQALHLSNSLSGGSDSDEEVEEGVKTLLLANGTLGAPPLAAWTTLRMVTAADEVSVEVGGEAALEQFKVADVDSGFVAIGTNGWYAVEFDDFSVSRSNDTLWSAPTSKCSEPRVGDVLTVRPCLRNGARGEGFAWQLRPNWQLRLRGTSLCAEASGQEANASVRLARCTRLSAAQEGSNQQFLYDYTNVRNARFAFSTSAGLYLQGDGASGRIGLGSEEDIRSGQRFSLWSYFPNQGQLRNQYISDSRLGYPLCLSVCSSANASDAAATSAPQPSLQPSPQPLQDAAYPSPRMTRRRATAGMMGPQSLL